MNKDVDYLKNYLKKYNINPSTIRLNVLDILLSDKEHLTAEDIYINLKKLIPTLSKTSIYNTLDIFSQKGLIKPITLHEKENRYDIKVNPHGHFKCIKCNKIYDFNIDHMEYKDLKDFKILEKDIQIYGICKDCK